MTHPRRALASVACALVLAAGSAAPAADRAPALPPAREGAVDFARDVRPLLAARCFGCHGVKGQKGGLRLDGPEAARAGGNRGPALVPGRSGDSRLVHAVAGTDPDNRMPPEGPALTAAEIGTLRAWIDGGADYGTQAAPAPAAPGTGATHWSFRPVRRPAAPEVRDPKWPVRIDIDRFVLARLEKEGLSPSPEADRPTLIRRLHLDLTGLPPTPKEVDDFAADPSPTAYERLADRLLASPHYGERWGRHWLDVARYADSDGYEKDGGRPHAWRFRNWVIDALNADLPFDRFTVEQLAGDLLPNATIEQKIATGFHRNALTNREGGIDPEEFRVAACIDRTSTTGQAWLGLTVGCAQCHDHKYDPLSQREFYRLFAYFNSDREAEIAAPLPAESTKLRPMREAFERERARLVAAAEEARAGGLPKEELTKRERALRDYEKKLPGGKAMTLALGPTRPTRVLVRGDFLRPGVEVTAGTPAALPPLPAGATGPGAAGTRLELARWLVSPENPLTPRVAANWAWSKFFGRGLVATPEDFGAQGERPSHPDLLDWLADEFRSPAGCNWSLKELHRRVVRSATYRQSSAARVPAPGAKDAAAADPLNVLLWRQSRLRLEAEVVRDGALAAAGLLTRTVGGPSVRPPQPPGVSELTYANAAKWVESVGPDRYKRGMYVWFQRTSPYPMLTAFDAPESNVCAVRRERSNTPLQALTLMNDAAFVEAAQALARRALAEKDRSPRQRAAYAFRLCLSREPTAAERERLGKLLDDFAKLAAASPAEAPRLIGPYKSPGATPAESAAWVALCRTLLNLDEFVTRE